MQSGEIFFYVLICIAAAAFIVGIWQINFGNRGNEMRTCPHCGGVYKIDDFMKEVCVRCGISEDEAVEMENEIW
jgi:hypothetical protein